MSNIRNHASPTALVNRLRLTTTCSFRLCVAREAPACKRPVPLAAAPRRVFDLPIFQSLYARTQVCQHSISMRMTVRMYHTLECFKARSVMSATRGAAQDLVEQPHFAGIISTPLHRRIIDFVRLSGQE